MQKYLKSFLNIFKNTLRASLSIVWDKIMSAHAFWFMKDTPDSELVMGMFEIDDQAWNFDS